MFSWMKALVVLLCFMAVSSCQIAKTRQPTADPARTAEDESILINRDLTPLDEERKVQKFDRLVDYKPYKYEVLFTDPVCGIYNYKTPVKSQSGKLLKNKPKNVYCRNKYDQLRSGSRPTSPQYRLVEWINDSNTKEIFLTYLSFTNRAVKNALCDAGKRGVKIRLVMSSTENTTAADELISCKPENIQKKVRGKEGDLGFAHNKFFIVNPNSKYEFKIVFSSGNMTSGPVIHHENWNFITTSPDSHFAQAHLCVMNAEWSDEDGRSRTKYIESVRNCRRQIKNPEEKDIRSFFIPGEGEPFDNAGKKTASEYMLEGDGELPGINTAGKIWIGCHRFFYSTMLKALKDRMSGSNKPEIRIVADDDTFYKANDTNFTEGETDPAEWGHMEQLQKVGAKLKFMETNPVDHQLHHSKYLIFADGSKTENPVDSFKAVLAGSANLTGAGFKTNWENIYYITIPEVVKSFANHYVHTWDNLATAVPDLPDHGMVDGELMDAPIF